MRISSRGRYGLQMMAEFARNPDMPTKIWEVSQRQGISEKYLEQIVSSFNKAGLVKSIRGAQGGYVLSRPAQEYSIGEILRVAEGSLAPVSCLDADSMPCGNEKYCASRSLYKRIEDAINEVVDNYTLAQFLDEECISSRHINHSISICRKAK